MKIHVDRLSGLRRRYRTGRVIGLAALIFVVVAALVSWNSPQPVWAVGGLVAGVMAEDVIRTVIRKVRLSLRRVDPGRTRAGEFHLGPASWPTEIVDLPPGGISLDAILIRVDGTLRVPQYLQTAAEHLHALLQNGSLLGDVVFDDNPCLIAVEPPAVSRREEAGRENVAIAVNAAPSRYFIKALARGGLPDPVLTHVRSRWPEGVTDPEDIRATLVGETDGPFDPLRHPGLGLCLATIINDDGVLYAAWQERGSRTAVNADRLTVPINESLTLSDRNEHLPTADMRRWFSRSVSEEIGPVQSIGMMHVEGAMWDLEGGGSIDRNGVPSGGGLIFVGWVELLMSPDAFMAMNARDRFEARVLHLIPLNVHDVSTALQSALPER